MILSVRYNYIYIRTRKTGSTTAEWVLSRSLGLNDVRLGQDFRVLGPLLKPGASLPEREVRKFIPNATTHVAIDVIKPLLLEEFWNGAFKFTSERHPYEKAVSLAFMTWPRYSRQRQERHAKDGYTFANYLDKTVRQGKYLGLPLYSIDGDPVVDDFIRLENLRGDLERIGERLGIPIPAEFPTRRGDSREDKRPAREILSDEQKQIVWQRCSREFEMLGYER